MTVVMLIFSPEGCNNGSIWLNQEKKNNLLYFAAYKLLWNIGLYNLFIM